MQESYKTNAVSEQEATHWKPNTVTQIPFDQIQKMTHEEILLSLGNMDFGNLNIKEIDKMNEKEMSAFLTKAKFAEEIQNYSDPKGINQIPLENFSPEVQSFVPLFKKVLNGPVIFDGIEDVKVAGGTPDKSHRKVTREIINKLSPNIYKFWESNKLQSSNISSILSTVSQLSDMGLIKLSPDSLGRLEDLRQSIHVDDEESQNKFSANRYIKYLNTKEKFKVVKSFETFLEDVILEQVEKK